MWMKAFEDRIWKKDLNLKIRELILENYYYYGKMVKRKRKPLKLNKIEIVKSESYDFTVEKGLRTTDTEKMVEYWFNNYKN